MAESKTSKRMLAAHERARQALELRKAGVSITVIAQQLGYTNASGAYKAVERAILAVLREPAEAVIELELARLDEMLFSIWPRVRAGDVLAVDRALRIMERRAKYLGLDAPKRVDITATLKAMAVEHGLDPDEVLRDAQDLIKESQA